MPPKTFEVVQMQPWEGSLAEDARKLEEIAGVLRRIHGPSSLCVEIMKIVEDLKHFDFAYKAAEALRRSS